MARREITITIEKGRDQGKKFKITEMPAMQAEQWAYRALSAAIANGMTFAGLGEGYGMADIARIGMNAISKIPFETQKVLLQELLDCVDYLPNKTDSSVTRKIEIEDIEDVSTLLKLRIETFKLHTDFFTNAGA